jgi:hypothetical protein
MLLIRMKLRTFLLLALIFGVGAFYATRIVRGGDAGTRELALAQEGDSGYTVEDSAPFHEVARTDTRAPVQSQPETTVDASAATSDASEMIPTERDLYEGMTMAEAEKHFKWLRETSPESALREEMSKLSRQMSQFCKAEVAQRLLNGEYQPIEANEAGEFALRAVANRNLVEFYAQNLEGKPVKIVLPKEKFPDAYVMKARINWLEDLVSNKRENAAR